MSNEKQYPAPDEIKGELEQYLAGPEAEAKAQKLNDAQVAKAKLQELGVDVPPQLQSQIEELQAKNPLNKIPKWATKNKWIKVLEARKEKLQGALNVLGDIKPAMRREIEADIKKIDEKLTEPKEEFGGLSQAEYAKKIYKVIGLKDEKEEGEGSLRLLEAVSEERFELAVKAAKELDPELKIPENLRDQVLTELSKLSPERVAEICSEMEKPILNIVSPNSFNAKVAQMNKNKHRDGQNDVFVAKGYYEPYGNVKSPNKVRVYLDDAMPKPAQKEDAPFALEARRKYELKRTSDKGLDLVGIHRFACLIQQSLIEAEETGDKSKIIDFETVTVLNPRSLTDSKYVACAYFGPDSREVNFTSSGLGNGSDAFRGRASVQVLEF